MHSFLHGMPNRVKHNSFILNVLYGKSLTLLQLRAGRFQAGNKNLINVSYPLSHRDRAALSAISRRRSGVIDAARFAPPIFPPRRPNSAITRLISDPVTGSGSGVSSS